MHMFTSESGFGLLLATTLFARVAIAGTDAINVQPPAPVPAKSDVRAGTFEIRGEGLHDVKDGATVKLNIVSYVKGEEFRPEIVATVKDGRFALSGEIDQPAPGVLMIEWDKQREATPLIVESAAFRVHRLGGEMLVADGGVYNDKVYAYRKMPAYIAESKKLGKAYARYEGVDPMDERAMKKVEKIVDDATKRNRAPKIQSDYLRTLIEGKSFALLKLFALRETQAPEYRALDKRLALLDVYEKELGAHPLIARQRKLFEDVRQASAMDKALAVGAHYKDIAVRDTDGNERRLSDVLAGNKLVMLDFWASWCSPCRAEFPHLAKVYKEFHARGFEIYAVSLDEEEKAWLKALNEERAKGEIPWINLREAGWHAASATAYGVLGLPTNFLLSSDGTILGKNLREWDVERAVRAKLEVAEKGGG